MINKLINITLIRMDYNYFGLVDNQDHMKMAEKSHELRMMKKTFNYLV